MSHIRRYFLTGLAVVLPTFVSFYILYVVGDALDGLLGGMFRGEWIRPGGIPGLGLLSLVLFILLIGIVTSKALGRRAVHLWDSLLAKVPILNRLYLGARQIVGALLQSESRVFRKVVLIEFPRPGCYALGFRTELADQEIRDRSGRQLVSVFLPTTPNPTSGYLLMLPVDEVVELDMDVEQGLKMVVSAGSVTRDLR